MNPQRPAWTTFETARDTARRLTALPPPAAADSTASGPASAAVRLAFSAEPAGPEIVGFGGALTESAAWALAKLPAERREAVLAAYFHPTEGLRYTLARTHINSCDFSVKPWELAPRAEDHALESFSLAPMREWVMPLIHDARRIAGPARLRLLASPWSPPAWMKTNASMLNGGQLRPDCRASWAKHYVRFIEALREEEGVPVWALTVQNEPAAKQVWESCLYSPEEERDFVRDHLGPALSAAGLDDVKLLVCDHNRDILEAYAGATFADPAASRHVWGAALHWYVSEDFAASRRLLDLHPGKSVLFTEGCWEGGVKLGRWDRAERYARNLLGDLNHGVRGWIDWNIALDTTGGPNHVGNLCDAPVLVDPETAEVHFQPSFYAIGHFSRFIEPGARCLRRLAVSERLDGAAFVNPDGRHVVVLHNASPAPLDYAIEVAGRAFAGRLPAHALHTCVEAA